MSAITGICDLPAMAGSASAASPPTSTLPTLIFRLARRGATTGGGSGGIPRETDMEPSVRAQARSAMIDVVQTRDTFDRAIAQDHEAVHLRQQLEVLRHETGVAREDLLSLRARHQAEAADV